MFRAADDGVVPLDVNFRRQSSAVKTEVLKSNKVALAPQTSRGLKIGVLVWIQVLFQNLAG